MRCSVVSFQWSVKRRGMLVMDAHVVMVSAFSCRLSVFSGQGRGEGTWWLEGWRFKVES